MIGETEVDMKPFQLWPSLVLLFLATGEGQSAEAIARTVYYSGRVQGVGFRATAVDIAKGFKVTGWVKNLADGRVQLVVEGTSEEVKKFLEAVRKHWKKNIEKEKVEEMKATNSYRGFKIRSSS